MLLIIILVFLCYFSATPSPLSYQQTSHASMSLGYSSATRFLYRQQSVISRGPANLSLAAVCTNQSCQLPRLQVGYYPSLWRLDLGYLSKFQDHFLNKKMPFFGLSFATPNDLACPPSLPVAWQPWLGVRNKKSVQVSLSDASTMLFLGQLDPDLHIFSTTLLSSGSYALEVEQTDDDGASIDYRQFVDQPLRPTRRVQSFSLRVGWPVGSLKLDQFGLPPVAVSSQTLSAYANYSSPWRLGFFHTNLGLANERWQLGAKNMITLGRVAIAPELLWQHDFDTQHDMGLGLQITWLPNINVATQISGYTFPQHPSDSSYPDVVHAQVSYQTTRWQHYGTWHWSSHAIDKYWQTKLSYRLGRLLSWQPSIAFVADKRDSQSCHLSLRLSAKQKHRQSNQISLVTSSRIQSLSWSGYYPSPWQHSIKLARTPIPGKPYLSASWRSGIASDVVKAHVQARVTNKYPKDIFWSLGAESSVSVVGGHIIWHQVASPWSNQMITLPASNAQQRFWCAHKHPTDSHEASIKSLHAYSRSCEPTQTESEQAVIYPGNLILRRALP